ncbi:MAG TPA: 2Fe-2S iron-sulfur cluster-binding protein [Pseudobdellovibrionaceae bacterium]|nr:2Fe-2S iron-sulfur cluster-binding protein [Pseudobdellovibrionaceae bacterium]
MEQGNLEIKIDGKALPAKEGQTLVEAARENGVFIPTLCDFKSLRAAGTCRVCTVKVNGRFTSGCTTLVSNGMTVENDSEEIINLRKGLIEMLFVEGNHMCPSCEKSGNCELQALGYRYRIDVPRYPYSFVQRKMDATLPHLLIEHNRCIQCLRCVRGVKAKDGHDLFGFTERGHEIEITIDRTDPEALTEKTAKAAMEICPVGALLTKGLHYQTPIGERKFDRAPIGSDIEKKSKEGL